MNRQTILAAIHRQLRESLAESGEVRPLGEVVGMVAQELRSSRNGQVTTGVIPIETVAAFVEGNLSAEESTAVCDAVLVDNSVLAELVAAVRAAGPATETFEPLPEVLNGQLLAMAAALPANENHSEQTPSPLARDNRMPIAEPLPVAMPTPTIVETPNVRLTRQAGKRHRQRHRPGPFAAAVAILSVAVTIAAIVFVANSGRRQDPEQPEYVRHQGDVLRDAAPTFAPDVDKGPRLRIVEADQDATIPQRPMIDDLSVPDFPTVADRGSNPSRTPNVTPRAIDPVVPRRPRATVPDAKAVANSLKLKGLRWTKITGLLARQSESSTNSQSRFKTWQSVAEGPAEPDTASTAAVVLRTLPLSRAEATLEGGGRVVLDSDCELQISQADATAAAEIHLHYGDMALVDLPTGTLIRLMNTGRPVALLQWQSEASAVLQHAADGLEIHVRHGTIDVNQQPQRDASVAIGEDRAIHTIEGPPRLPTWIERPIATIPVQQPVLAQLADSRNLMGTINQQLQGFSDRNDADPRTMATLALWQASLAGEHVFRLVGHQLPIVRLGALNRVASLPPWDPRYAATWATIERATGNNQRVQRFKQLSLLAQQQAPPSPALVDAMLDDLAAPSLATRAMSDYLLRRFYANRTRQLPNFDPTWTGQAQARSINLWRQFLGRTPRAAIRNQPNAGAVQRVQPAAAAANQPAGQRVPGAAPRTQPAGGAIDRPRQ